VSAVNNGKCLVDPTEFPLANYGVTFEPPLAPEVDGVQMFPDSEPTSYDIMFGEVLLLNLDVNVQGSFAECKDTSTVDYSTHVCRLTDGEFVFVVYLFLEEHLAAAAGDPNYELSTQTYEVQIRGINDAGVGPWNPLADVTCKA